MGPDRDHHRGRRSFCHRHLVRSLLSSQRQSVHHLGTHRGVLGIPSDPRNELVDQTTGLDHDVLRRTDAVALAQTSSSR